MYFLVFEVVKYGDSALHPS